MLVAAPLGGFREDAISTLSIVLGQQRASNLVSQAEAYVRSEAKAGAESAIPTIQAEVRATVRPYVIAALIVGGVGAIAGGYAIYRSVKG